MNHEIIIVVLIILLAVFVTSTFYWKDAYETTRAVDGMVANKITHLHHLNITFECYKEGSKNIDNLATPGYELTDTNLDPCYPYKSISGQMPYNLSAKLHEDFLTTGKVYNAFKCSDGIVKVCFYASGTLYCKTYTSVE